MRSITLVAGIAMAAFGFAVTAEESLAKLKEGNARFVSMKPINPNQDSARLAETSQGQSPFVTILSCADSRVSPEILFDQGIGDVFVIRSAGNKADDYGIASIEYSVAVLGVPLIVVLGHEACGAVDAAVKAFNGAEDLPSPFLMELVDGLLPAAEATADQDGDPVQNAVVANARISMFHILSESEIVRNAVARGDVKIVAGWSDLDTGEVLFLD